MSELVKSAPQYGVQTLKIVDGGARDEVIRKGYCQAHQQWSRNYQGMDQQGWLFRCANSKLHLSHLFHVRPSLHGPKELGVPFEEALANVEAWKQRERQAYRLKMEGKDRGA